MDREHVKGAADKAKGAIKEAAGKVAGDKELQSKGSSIRRQALFTTPRATRRTLCAMYQRTIDL